MISALTALAGAMLILAGLRYGSKLLVSVRLS